jgi:hypothetical protein
MSEHGPNSQEVPKQNVSPEQQRAFRGVYSQLMKLTAEKGHSVMITHIGDKRHSLGSFSDPEIAVMRGIEYTPDAQNLRLHIPDPDGNRHGAWATMLDESASHKMGILGMIEVQEKASHSHPADIYWLLPDNSIEHVYRYSTDDGQYEDGDPINWVEHAQDKGLLNTQQMEDLQHALEAASV